MSVSASASGTRIVSAPSASQATQWLTVSLPARRLFLRNSVFVEVSSSKKRRKNLLFWTFWWFNVEDNHESGDTVLCLNVLKQPMWKIMMRLSESYLFNRDNKNDNCLDLLSFSWCGQVLFWRFVSCFFLFSCFFNVLQVTEAAFWWRAVRTRRWKSGTFRRKYKIHHLQYKSVSWISWMA